MSSPTEPTSAPPQSPSSANPASPQGTAAQTTTTSATPSTAATPAAPSTAAVPTSSSNAATASGGGPPANTPAAAPTAATIANSSNPDAYEHVHAPGQTDNDGLTLRALVSSKEAGVIIGRGGATIAQVRQDANVKAGVSKVVPGVPDRVLSIGGTVESVAKAYSIVARTILENPVPSANNNQRATNEEGAATTTTTTPALNPSASASIRLLISHLLIGSVIGKGGSKIRQIQELAHARMVASKEMLPQSTERIVEVTGQPESVRLAVQEIAKCLIEDWDRSQGTVLYHPGAEGLGGAAAVPGGANANGAAGFPGSQQQQHQQGGGFPSGRQQGGGGPRGGVLAPGAYGVRNGPNAGGRRGGGGQQQQQQQQQHQQQQQQQQQSGSGAASSSNNNSSGLAGTVVGNESDPNWREQKISIPSDMVGCIIGRGGTKINEIRRQSGSRISIAKTAHDETGERMFVISGLPENNEKALFLLYNQLESEKERRVQSVQEEQQQQQAQQQQQQAQNGGNGNNNKASD
ncbi:hypothetical protein C6P46_004108 [Rhodotorula mucilaginosa]|uniref:K Homology domain-containing protein n=1 Tax=Rhodotorula mucilaginosa TaxID=5537 RepID=A0A9P6W1J5_RHOMI|nr:hypothetical protein C6P46_004108 [Rhodotorula mucilaginosa]